MGTAVRSLLNFIARLLVYATAITKGRDEQRVTRSAKQEHDHTADWAAARIKQMHDEFTASKTTMLEFPGFSPLWSFGTVYRDAESKWHHGPPGWYGIAHEFGGSERPLSADPPGVDSGHHEVGPESDPTSALLAIMRYVQDLEAERESEHLDAEKEIFGHSGTR